MDVFNSMIQRSADYILTMTIGDIVDILVVAFLIYRAIWFIRRTNSVNLAKGIFLVLIVWALSELFGLSLINFIIRKLVNLGIIALVILFQPELRRVLERVGSGFTSSRGENSSEVDSAVVHVVLACGDMSESKTGALIIFERNVLLNEIMSTGTVVNADVTAELIKNIFFNKAPLHDGALVIREGRIAAAGCVLPLTKSTNLSKDLGMRHRAGIGLSEQSDAVVIIVSEETGAISVAVDGMLKRHLSAGTLERLLRSLLIPNGEGTTGKGFWNAVKSFFKGNKDEEDKSDKKTV